MTIQLILFLIFKQIYFAKEVNILKKVDDFSTICIYRKNKYVGSASNIRISVNSRKVCELSSNRYLILKSDSSSITIDAGNSFAPRGSISLKCQRGRSYYVECKPGFSHITLKLVDSLSANEDLRKVLKKDNCIE